MSQTEGRLVGGRYHLVEPIGRGGMGVVWRAHDELLDREVAVKEVRYDSAMGDELSDLNRRTMREARAAGRLTHPNVVVVHDVIEEDGRPWIIMQLVRSRSLGQVIREDGPLSPDRTVEIGLQILDALRAAHLQGVLHRDVKPENVLLTDDGRVVLTDFGIARLEADSTMTRTGLVGTPAFIAPERLRGGPAQRESDLWSLGATLYSAVEGKPPHDRGMAMATMHAVLNDEPTLPGRAGRLGPVLLRLLAKEPADRPGYDETARLLKQAARPTSPTGTALMPAVHPSTEPPTSSAPAPGAGVAKPTPSRAGKAPSPAPAKPPASAARSGTASPAGSPAGGPPPASAGERSSSQAKNVPDPEPASDRGAEHPAGDDRGAAAAGSRQGSTSPGAQSATTSGDHGGSPGSGDRRGPAASRDGRGRGEDSPDMQGPAPAGSDLADDDWSDQNRGTQPPGSQHLDPQPRDPQHQGDHYPADSDGYRSGQEAAPGEITSPIPVVRESGRPATPSAAAPTPSPSSPAPAPASKPAVPPGPASPSPTTPPPARQQPMPETGAQAVPTKRDSAPSGRRADDAGPGWGGVAAEPTADQGGTPAAPTQRSEIWREGAETGPVERRPRPMLKAALVIVPALAVIAGVAGYLGLREGKTDSGNGATDGKASSSAPPSRKPSSPSASASEKPSQASSTPTPSDKPSPTPTTSKPADVPDGWHRYKDKTGFSVALPDGWKVDRRDSTGVWFRGPDRSRYLLIGMTDKPKSDAVKDWKSQEKSAGFPGYNRVRIESVDYYEEAADWEFTWRMSSGKAHVLNRGFVTDKHHGYAIYWHTLDNRWKKDFYYFETFAATFTPAK
ncbi:protein kinase domain-containing protein [Planotetraspora sp. GP83]|uniref:serine/threonine protein kinase n=1 Tax=Planotetraspora sp. GP83 TaxID=3156264 RepID=UPI003515F245